MILFLVLVSYCRNYVNVSDHSRFWNIKERSVSDIERSCQDQLPYWTRFIYDNTTNAIVPHNCTTSQPDFPNPPCGSLYRGWIKGEHASPKEGNNIALFSDILFPLQLLTLLCMDVGWILLDSGRLHLLFFISNCQTIAEVKPLLLFEFSETLIGNTHANSDQLYPDTGKKSNRVFFQYLNSYMQNLSNLRNHLRYRCETLRLVITK